MKFFPLKWENSRSPIPLKSIFLLTLFLLLYFFVSAQQVTITGKVTTGDSALADVTITVRNSNIATKTNELGFYTLSVPANATLVFSSVGFVPREIKVGSGTVVNVELTAQTLQLDDVVVVGYGTQRKGSVTGSVSSIKSADLMRTPSSATSTALVGKLAGITARQSTGRPGEGTVIQIRNYGTPLYVIDGVPQSEGQFNQISPEDIENISILKDAAAAIYGFRASNGVVLVTTKKGKGQKTTLKVSSYYQLQSVTRYPSASDAYTYVRALAEAEQNEKKPVTITPEILEKWKQGTEPGFQSTNYRDFILQKTSPQRYINVNASGGTENMNYYLSVGGLKQEGLVNNYDFNRWNFQSNVEGTVFRGLKLGTRLSGRIEHRHNPASTTGASSYDNPFLAILTMWPTERVYANENPDYINADVNNPSRNPLIYDENIIGKEDNTWRNIATIFYANFTLPFGITGSATYSYNNKQNMNEMQRNSFNFYSYKPATDSYEPVAFNLASRNKGRREIMESFAQLLFNYNKKLGLHTIAATAGYEYATARDQSFSVNAVPPTNYSPIIRTLDITTVSDGYSKTKRASVIGKVNYEYRRRYLLEVSGRYDGTHLYAPGKRWGLFPGFSAGWVLSNESFWSDKLRRIINNVKLRASYGETAQEGTVDPFDYLSGGTFGAGSYVFDNGLVTGTDVRGIPITNLTWVSAISKNIGIELGFFNNALTAEFDVATRDLTGIPAPKYDVLLPSEVGYSLPDENLNSQRTYSAEGIITYTKKSGEIPYYISANATLARRKNIDIYKPRFGNSWDEYRNRIDHRWNNIHWGYQVIGQFQSVEEIKNYPVNNDGQGNRTQLPGDLIFKDVNGDGLISNLDERPIGYGGLDGSTFGGNTPYMSFGLTAGVSYKGFNLVTDWAGATMQTYYRIFELAIPFQAIHNAPEYIFNDRWHRADLFDPTSPWIPGTYPAIRRTGSGNHVNYTRHSDFWISNVNYVRLRNLELSYNLPKQWLRVVHLNTVKVYANATNLFSIDNVKDIEIDPEISQNNGLVYPVVKLYTFGINITL